ncbi:BMP family protein [Kocuria palustris]|uniref:BMP family lipoprotein n=1 Tax=Kocuria palustris TaxID=71999 RepID=UPI0016432D95|nr:BMP family ABC transporter substrate-binding protein [Kocuria palustris]
MTFRRRALAAAPLAVASALVLSSCGELPQDSAVGGEQDAFAGCVVSDRSGFAGGWSGRGALDGLEAAAGSTGIEVREAESRAEDDYGPNLASMLQSGCDLTVAAGSQLADAVRAAAEQNPERDFAVIGGGIAERPEDGPDNVKPVVHDSAEAAFLAGYLAAGVSGTGTVGAFGAERTPEITEVLDGFAAGVEHWNEQNDDDVELLGWDAQEQEGAVLEPADDEEADEAARAAAQELLDQGADVVLPAAGRTAAAEAAQAVAEAGSEAEEDDAAEDPLFVGIGEDGYDALPPEQRRHQLTAVLLDVAGPVEQIATSAADGGFDTAPYIGTLENGGVGIAEYHDQADRVGEDLAADVARLRHQVIDGEVAVESGNPPRPPA